MIKSMRVLLLMFCTCVPVDDESEVTQRDTVSDAVNTCIRLQGRQTSANRCSTASIPPDWPSGNVIPGGSHWDYAHESQCDSGLNSSPFPPLPTDPRTGQPESTHDHCLRMFGFDPRQPSTTESNNVGCSVYAPTRNVVLGVCTYRPRFYTPTSFPGYPRCDITRAENCHSCADGDRYDYSSCPTPPLNDASLDDSCRFACP